MRANAGTRGYHCAGKPLTARPFKKVPFSEAVKVQVKRKADFRCCRCREVGIDIHHIVPEAQGGPSDIDNAAPLCQNCHDRFGANPEKRKEIRQMRDWWYEIVQEKFHGDQSAIEKLNESLLKVQANIQASNQADNEKLRSEVMEAVKQILAIQGRAAEQLKYVSVSDIARQANTAVLGSSNIQRMGMPEPLRHAAEQKKE
jgi:hypothetical protein